MLVVPNTVAMRRSSVRLLTPQLAAAGLVVMWSSGFIGSRLGTDHASADALLAWRFLIAASLLVGWTVVRSSWVPRGTRLRHAVIGWLTQCGYLGGVVTGVGLGVPAGTAALIAALQPLLIGAIAARVLGERVTSRQWSGFWLGVAGVALVVGGDLGRGSAPLAAYLLPIGGMLSLAAGTVLERRWRPAGTLVQAMTLHALVGAVFFVGVAAINGHLLVSPVDPAFALAVAWTVGLSHLGGYGFYMLVLRQGGATRVSTLLYLTPPITMVWAFVMFGDPLTAAGLGGFVICAVAVGMVLNELGVAGVGAAGARRRVGDQQHDGDGGSTGQKEQAG